MSWAHFNAECNIDSKSILQLPGKLPQDFMNKEEDKKNEMKFNVKNVIISNSFE